MQTPNDVKDFLLVIAQVSVTLGGFASVVKAVKRMGEDMERRDFIGLQLTVEHSFAALFAALLPLACWYSGFQTPSQQSAVWCVASALVAIFLAAELVGQIVRIKGVTPRHPWLLRLHFLPGTILCFLAMVTNAWRWQSEVLYIWALVWLLNPPCLQLYTFFFRSQAEADVGARLR